jgi:hypothetical protein
MAKSYFAILGISPSATVVEMPGSWCRLKLFVQLVKVKGALVFMSVHDVPVRELFPVKCLFPFRFHQALQ